LFIIEPGKSSLFLSFDFDLDEIGKYYAIDVDVDFAFNEVSRLVEGVLSLNLNFATFKTAAVVGKEEHLIKIQFK
jgi:hypothetical protein